MMWLWLIAILLCPISVQAASISGGASTGGGGGGYTGSSDVSDVSVTTATNPSAEAGLKELTIPAGMMNTLGRRIYTHASGRYTTATGQTPTLRFRWYLCTVSGCGSGTVLTLMDFTTQATTAATTNSWEIEGHIGTAAIGATGTIESKFIELVQLGAAGSLTPEERLDQNNAVSSTIDLTAALYLRLTVLMSSANAGNSVSQRMGYIAGGGGAPTSSGYITTIPDSVLSNETALSGLATGCMSSTTATGVVATRVITGTANQITVTSGDCSGNPTISIPNNPTLPGTTTATISGNASTATALAANPADCSAGSAPIGIDASGVAQGCADFVEDPAANGLVARTAANTSAARTITGTANQIDLTNGNGVSGNPTLTISSTLNIPGPGIEFTETAGDSACAAGNYWIKANSTTTNFRKCQNGTVTDLDTGGAGSIGGSSGSTDRAVIIANGTGGGTVQGSGCTISAGNLLTCPGGFASTTGTGVLVLLEGTPPGAGANAGETNFYVDSSDHKFKSQLNGSTVQVYARASDNLSIFASTTSAQLASILSDETGSGANVFGTSPTLGTPTINTPTFGGSNPTLASGITWTFVPNASNSGINMGSLAGDPSSPLNGDIWYNSTTGKFRTREGGSNKDVISSGAGTGDVTDVNAGAGIAVATPGGPAPTVSWDASTFVNNVTMWDAANASRTWTANLSGATDPVITFSDASIDVTTGTLKQGGVSVTTASTTDTFTNKSYDAEGTGNVLTVPKRVWFPAAGCNNATAGSVWDLPTSAPAVAACVTGTNTQKGVLDFADGSNLSAQIHHKLPSTWTGNIDANIKWFSATTSGDVVWQIATICVADAETDDPAFNTASTVTDTTKGTTNQTNDATITSVTVTGCAAGELMHVKVFRDSGNASDTMAGTARLIGVELVMREAI